MKFTVLSLLLITKLSWALPLPSHQHTVPPPQSFAAKYNFDGIVALSDCSGSLIRLENSRDTDSAWVMTNGHCLETGFTDPGQIVYGKPSTRAIKIFNTQGEYAGRLTATQIMYGTMTKTDLALYKVQETYGEIKSKYGVNALLLSSQHPKQNDAIEIVSGYWKLGYNCAIEAISLQLREDKWTWQDSMRYSRPGCKVIGGTSGSPILAKDSRTVIGINNTGNDSGEMCTMDNPCEVGQDGTTTAQKGYSYGQQTYWIYSCLNQYNELDLSIANCELPK